MPGEDMSGRTQTKATGGGGAGVWGKTNHGTQEEKETRIHQGQEGGEEASCLTPWVCDPPEKQKKRHLRAEKRGKCGFAVGLRRSVKGVKVDQRDFNECLWAAREGKREHELVNGTRNRFKVGPRSANKAA